MYEYRCTLVRAIDGDTVEVDVDLGFKITQRQIIRLYGINTPERGEFGYTQAKDYVSVWFKTRTDVIVSTRKDKADKYGRYLGTFYVDEAETLNDALVYGGLAKEYYP